MVISPRVKQALSRQASGAAIERIDREYEQLCVELVSEWLLGERRFESVSQQTEHWLARLYDVIYVDEQPEATRLYERFQIPLPRAQYVARLLMARRAAQWRNAARVELRATLRRLEKSARDAIADSQGSVQRYETSLSRGAYDELIVIYENLSRSISDTERPAPPRKLPSSPTLVWFSITAETAVAVLTALDKELADAG